MIGSRGRRGYGLSLCYRCNGVLRLEGSHAEGETAKQGVQGRGRGQKRIRGLDWTPETEPDGGRERRTEKELDPAHTMLVVSRLACANL